jgi:hypothetical protein
MKTKGRPQSGNIKDMRDETRVARGYRWSIKESSYVKTGDGGVLGKHDVNTAFDEDREGNGKTPRGNRTHKGFTTAGGF